MASFSFGSGNLQKLLRLPLYVGGRALTCMIPRTGRWVFGCGAGVGDGSLALWHEAIADGQEVLWLAADDGEFAEAEARGMPVLRRDGWRGFWATARAGVLVVSYGTGDVNPYGIGGGFLVQLWHGIPLKRIGLDSPATLRLGPLGRIPGLRRLLAAAYRRRQRAIRLLPAASHLVRGRLQSAFDLPDETIVVTGEPRVDVLSKPGAVERARSELVDALGGMPDGAKVILYAPTWRDGEPDPAVPDAADWGKIIDLLEHHNAVLAIRSHRLGRGAYLPPQGHPRIRDLSATVRADVTPLLPGVDVLVSDYSSLVYDVGLCAIPVVFLAPDAEEYARRRGFYGRFRDLAGDDPAKDWRTAVADLHTLLADPAAFAERAERSARLSRDVHAFRDGGNSGRVYAAITVRTRSVGMKGRG